MDLDAVIDELYGRLRRPTMAARASNLLVREHQYEAERLLAGRLTAQAGLRISDGVQREVQETLQAMPADPDAARQWAQGRLTKPSSAPVGFPAPPQTPTERPAPRRGTEPSGRLSDLDAARTRRQEQQERLQRALREAANAERQLKEREEALTDAQKEQNRAEQRQEQAREAGRRARGHARDADRAVREVRRRTEDAAAHAQKLAEQVRSKPSRT
ncbi:hypothetical protein [Streptomyces sp. UG1]|uniref:hypothetical protein n=1 Tax=Streptomyces sp. UG1 TaxID=3417652 RepID=UPI003CF0EB50